MLASVQVQLVGNGPVTAPVHPGVAGCGGHPGCRYCAADNFGLHVARNRAARADCIADRIDAVSLERV